MIDFVLKYKVPFAVGTLILMLWLIILGLKVDNLLLRSNLETAQAQNQTLAISNQSLGETIKGQNEAINRLQAEAAARELAGKVAIRKAQESAAIYQRNAFALMARTPTGDECSSTKTLFNEALRHP